MAKLEGVFFSKTLARPVHFVAVLCNDNAMGTPDTPYYKRPTKNVYLLHGYSGCDTDWSSNVALGDLANKYNVNFFMPNGDNSFYLDNKATGYKYATYVGEEFVNYTRKTFNLSDSREDTYIGGLSMGGFGALHTGLMFNKTFSKILALSSALIQGMIKVLSPDMPDNPMANYDYYAWTFGLKDGIDFEASENNPEYLVKKLAAEGAQFPDIYMACGTEDFLIEPNKAFKAFLDENKVPVTFFTGPGVHDFNFWRAQLVAGLEWAFK
ncbi:MAG: esterase [Lachnospiraceae bacterium]|nr:esterase [Lachnospiraceae bacterium]